MDKIGDYLIIIVGVRKRVSIRENVDISWSHGINVWCPQMA